MNTELNQIPYLCKFSHHLELDDEDEEDVHEEEGEGEFDKRSEDLRFVREVCLTHFVEHSSRDTHLTVLEAIQNMMSIQTLNCLT